MESIGRQLRRNSRRGSHSGCAWPNYRHHRRQHTLLVLPIVCCAIVQPAERRVARRGPLRVKDRKRRLAACHRRRRYRHGRQALLVLGSLLGRVGGRVLGGGIRAVGMPRGALPDRHAAARAPALLATLMRGASCPEGVSGAVVARVWHGVHRAAHPHAFHLIVVVVVAGGGGGGGGDGGLRLARAAGTSRMRDR